MKRVLMVLLGVSLLTLAGYSVARYYTGQVLEREVDQLATELEASDDIEVRRLTYLPGVFQGELEYDLRLRLPAGHPLVDLLRLSAPDSIPQWIDFRGQARLSQGPHPTRDGVVLAWAEQSWPGLKVRAGLKPDGTVIGELQGEAFRGQLHTPDGEPVQVDLSAWQGDFRWHPEQQTLELATTLDQLLLDQAGFQGEIRNAVAALEFSVSDPVHWMSRTDIRADRLELASDVSGTRLESARILAHVERRGDRIDNRLEVDIGESLVEEYDLRRGELRLALSDLDAAAWMALMEELAMGSADGQFDMARQERVIRATDDLLAAGPTVHVERLAVTLYEDASDDLAGALRLYHPGGGGASMRDPIDLLEQSEVRLSLLATTGALRRISQWRAEAQARELAAERGIMRTEEQIQRSAATLYRTTLVSLQFMPLVTVADGKAETHLQMRDGDVYRNDERIMPVTQVLRLFGL